MPHPLVIPSLYAPDLSATIRFYVETLGFSQTGSYANDDGVPIWAEVRSGEARLWFFSQPLPDHPNPSFSGMIYVAVGDVDGFASRIADHIEVAWGPETMDYGYRELGVRDCNGYLLVFAQET